MSRLYNTLEKIRTGQQGAFSKKRTAPAKGVAQNADRNRKRWFVLLGASALLALALLVFFAGPKRKEAKPPLTAEAVAPGQIPEPPASRTADSPKLPPAPPAGTKDLYLQLNNTGMALIQENQHWRGIYFFEQARKQQPERPEALINMAVALAELGLRAPAKRLFSEAHALAPNHPLLRQNLDLLGQADFFDGQWLSSLTAGPAQAKPTTPPQ